MWAVDPLPPARTAAMNERRFSALADLPHAIRRQWTDLPVNYRQWRDDLKADHSLFWRTTAVRIGLWILLGVAVLIGLRALMGISGFSAVGPLREEPTPLATLYVACTSPVCRHPYVSRQAMDFNDWPLKCPQCEAESVYRAHLCPECREWYAIAPQTPGACPTCADRAAARAPSDDDSAKSSNPDDDEDDW